MEPETNTPVPPQENPNNAMPDQPTPEAHHKSHGLGMIIVVVILVAFAILAALYLAAMPKPTTEPTPEDIRAEQDTQREALEIQSSSDEIADIEADLEATELDSIDAELQMIDGEL